MITESHLREAEWTKPVFQNNLFELRRLFCEKTNLPQLKSVK